MKFNTNETDLHQATRVSLKSAVIPNTQYNITIANNTFVWRLDSDTAGVVRTVVVPVGQYTTDLLITVLATDTGLTITQNPTTFKITFARAQNFTIYNKDTNPMATTLGVDTGSSNVQTMTGQNLPDLGGLRHIYVASSTLSNNVALIADDKQKNNVFCDIPVIVPFGAVQIEDNDANTLDYTDFPSRKNISMIDIRLLDERNNVLDLNGLDFVLVFRIYF
jgi:hypothetical protein